MVGRSSAYGVFVGKPEGKRPLGRIRHSCEDGIRIDIKEVGWEGVDRIDLTQHKEKWEVILYMVMNVRVP
jgi:hypothetical protein